MTDKKPLLEVSWVKGKGYCSVLVGWWGRWIEVSEHRTKAECMKAVTKVHKKLAGHPALMAAALQLIDRMGLSKVES